LKEDAEQVEVNEKEEERRRGVIISFSDLLLLCSTSPLLH
jgi:hypothetical protein